MAEGKYRPCAADPVIIKDRKVLMTRRSFGIFEGCWSLPGGMVDVGEDARTCCVREAKEETNLDVRITHSLGYYDAPDRDPEKQAVTFAFICEVVSGEPRHCEEATDIRWFPLDSLPDKIAWDHRKVIEDAGKLFEGKP